MSSPGSEEGTARPGSAPPTTPGPGGITPVLQAPNPALQALQGAASVGAQFLGPDALGTTGWESRSESGSSRRPEGPRAEEAGESNDRRAVPEPEIPERPRVVRSAGGSIPPSHADPEDQAASVEDDAELRRQHPGMWHPGMQQIKLSFPSLSSDPASYEQWRVTALLNIKKLDLPARDVLDYLASMNAAGLDVVSQTPSDSLLQRLDLQVDTALRQALYAAKSEPLSTFARTLTSSVQDGCGRHTLRLLDQHMKFDLRMKMAAGEKWLTNPKCPSLGETATFLHKFRYWRDVMSYGGNPQSEHAFLEKLRASVQGIPELQGAVAQRRRETRISGLRA